MNLEKEILRKLRMNQEDGLTQSELKREMGIGWDKLRIALARLDATEKIIYTKKGSCKVWKVKK